MGEGGCGDGDFGWGGHFGGWIFLLFCGFWEDMEVVRVLVLVVVEDVVVFV